MANVELLSHIGQPQGVRREKLLFAAAFAREVRFSPSARRDASVLRSAAAGQRGLDGADEGKHIHRCVRRVDDSTAARGRDPRFPVTPIWTKRLHHERGSTRR